MALSSLLTKLRVPKQDQKHYEEIIRGSKKVLDIFAKMCYNSVVNAEKSSIEDFKDPNWAFHHAFRLGQIAAYRDLQRALTINNDEETTP